MADFCRQCSMDLFQEDFYDLRGLGDGTPLTPGKGWSALCEGCGATVVDDDGVCISFHCFRKHGKETINED